MSKSIATFSTGDTLPAHLQQGVGLGNENVTADTMALPRIDMIQMLSPQKQKANAKYIEGAKDGDLFNTLTGELYTHVFLVNLVFERQFSIFKDRKLGGGFEGSFDSMEAAVAHMEREGLDPKQYDVSETGIHKCLMLDESGNPKQPVLIYMAKSKLRVSNAWNSNIQLKNQGADRFATVWTLSSVEESNKQGQPYFNYKVDFAGFAGEALFAEAKKFYFGLRGETVPPESTH